jgi:hypothetical protein
MASCPKNLVSHLEILVKVTSVVDIGSSMDAMFLNFVKAFDKVFLLSSRFMESQK